MNYADHVAVALALVVQEDVEVDREVAAVLAEVDLTETVEDNRSKSSDRKD